jgi:hypothetical protein
MKRDAAPVIAAEALLAHDVDDDRILAYLVRRWELDEIDARSAVAAARVIAQREPDARTALPPDAGDATAR